MLVIVKGDGCVGTPEIPTPWHQGMTRTHHGIV